MSFMKLVDETRQCNPGKTVTICKIRVLDEEHAETFNLTVGKIYDAVYVKTAPWESAPPEHIYWVAVFYKTDVGGDVHSYYHHKKHTDFTIDEFNDSVWWIEMISDERG